MKKPYNKALLILDFTRWPKFRRWQGTNNPNELFAKAEWYLFGGIYHVSGKKAYQN